MSARQFESFLARVYVDASARAAFKSNPMAEALRAGLSHEECAALEKTDWIDLEMAARSFAHKRGAKLVRNRRWILLERLRRIISIF